MAVGQTMFKTYRPINSLVTSDKENDESGSPEKFQPNDPTEMSRKEAREQSKRRYRELVEAGGKIRPHTELDLSRGAFEGSLTKAIDGETAHIEEDDWSISVEAVFIESGRISLSGYLMQSVESSLSNSHFENSAAVDTPSIIEEYYSEGAASIQQDVEHYDIRNGYITLLRDMSESCAQAVNLMRDVVNEHPDLVWGEEPKITDIEGNYFFNGTIYYRPFSE